MGVKRRRPRPAPVVQHLCGVARVRLLHGGPCCLLRSRAVASAPTALRTRHQCCSHLLRFLRPLAACCTLCPSLPTAERHCPPRSVTPLCCRFSLPCCVRVFTAFVPLQSQPAGPCPAFITSYPLSSDTTAGCRPGGGRAGNRSSGDGMMGVGWRRNAVQVRHVGSRCNGETGAGSARQAQHGRICCRLQAGRQAASNLTSRSRRLFRTAAAHGAAGC